MRASMRRLHHSIGPAASEWNRPRMTWPSDSSCSSAASMASTARLDGFSQRLAAVTGPSDSIQPRTVASTSTASDANPLRRNPELLPLTFDHPGAPGGC